MLSINGVFKVEKILVKVPRKCHIHKAQFSRVSKESDEEQMMKKQMPHKKPPMHEGRRAVTEEWFIEKLLGSLTH